MGKTRMREREEEWEKKKKKNPCLGLGNETGGYC